MDRPAIHIVIVNWNSGRQLQECLASFAAISKDDVSLAHVTIVDNASADGSADGLTCPAPLNVIRNADNRGFAAACNQGAAGADADFLLFLNPDTQLMPGCLELPMRYLQATEHAAVGIVGIQLLDVERGGRTQHRAAANSAVDGRQQRGARPAAAVGFPHALCDRMGA